MFGSKCLFDSSDLYRMKINCHRNAILLLIQIIPANSTDLGGRLPILDVIYRLPLYKRNLPIFRKNDYNVLPYIFFIINKLYSVNILILINYIIDA